MIVSIFSEFEHFAITYIVFGHFFFRSLTDKWGDACPRMSADVRGIRQHDRMSAAR